MKFYVIQKEADNTYFTGISRNNRKDGIKTPVFSTDENKAKIYRELNKARLDRSKMSKYRKMNNISIIELHTERTGEH